MNCEQFRQRLLTDPYSDDPPFRAHARECSECAQALEEARRFEQCLHAALRAELSSPGGRERQRPGRAAPLARGLAFLLLPLLVLVLWYGLGGGFGPGAPADLATAVIAHIVAEEEYLYSTRRVPRDKVQELFQSMGAALDRPLGTVRFAGRCVVAEGEGIHLILAGERGAVTALFLPAQDVPEKRELAGSGLAGFILPAGSGSLAIVGNPGEPLSPLARRLLAAVHWRKPAPVH